MTVGPEDDAIPIDPAILDGESMHEDAQNVDDPEPAPDTDPAPFNALQTTEDAHRSSLTRRLRNATDLEPPCKRSRSGSVAARDHQPTLYSCFIAASLSERLEFLSWLFKCGLSESLYTASVELPLTPAKTADKLPESPRIQRRPRRASPKGRRATSTGSRKGKAWDHDEIQLLIQLKKGGSSWSVIAKRFEERFPGRTLGTIRVYWSQNLKYLHKL
jgi:hypothetical protein